MKQAVAVVLAVLLGVGLYWLFTGSDSESTELTELDDITIDESSEIADDTAINNSPSTYMGPSNDELSFTTTDSGMQYAVITEGEGDQQPTVADTVTVHYHGTLDDGTVFDSSYERGQPISFPLSNLIKGWQEGIPMMTVGSKYRFIIPAELAYGPAGSGHQLAGQTLTFDVELLNIN